MKNRKVFYKSDNEEQKGVFHGWGMDYLEAPNGYVVGVTVGIIELLDGTVIKAKPEKIRFANPYFDATIN